MSLIRRLALLATLLVALPTTSVARAPATTATFVKADTTTAGNWPGHYGADGTQIAGYDAGLPAYATVSFALPPSRQPAVWAASTTDARAPQAPGRPATATRTAQCWHGVVNTAPNFTIDVNLTDGKPHAVALYCLDWDGRNRAKTVQVADASSGAVLDTRTASAFNAGVYLQWNVTGHVTFTLTMQSGGNAVLTGLYFDPPGTPPPARPATAAPLSAPSTRTSATPRPRPGPRLATAAPLSAPSTRTSATPPRPRSGPATVAVSPWVVKSGTLIAFGVNATAAPKVAGAAPTPAPISAVDANPTVYRNGKAVSLGAPTWFSRSKELPIVFYRLNCGSVRTIAVAKGGAGYTAAATVKWNGDGGGTSLELGTPVVKAGAIAWVPIAACSDDFTSPPTFTVTDPAATTPATLYPIMAGVKPGDTITYDAPANWISPVLGGHYGWNATRKAYWSDGKVQPVNAVTGGAVDNWAGRFEGASGGFGCFAQAPKMIPGVNVGGQPADAGGLTNTIKNRVKVGNAWQISGGGALTVDASGTPVSWTKPTTSTVSLWVHGPFGKGPLGDIWPSQPGRWTLRYDDPHAGTAAAAKVWLGSKYGRTLVSSTVVGRTVTAIYDIKYPAGAKDWALHVRVRLQAPAGPDGLGHYTISNLKAVPPDARDESPQPIAPGESDLEPDPNAVRGVAGVGVTRWMDATQNAGGGPDSQFILPGDPVNPDAPSWNTPGKKYSVRFVAARYFNTDPKSTTYPWSSPTIVGPQSLFASGLTLPPGDDGHSLADSAWLVVELRSAAPHGLTTGLSTSVRVEAGGVRVPIAGTTGTFAPTPNGRIAPTFVTGPNTIVVPIYNTGVKVPASAQPQRIGSTTEIDLTAGGTKPGWLITGHGPNHSVPYRFTGKFASRLPGSALWTNLPVSGSDDLFASIATDLAKDLDPSNKIWLELGNEIWNYNGSSEHMLNIYGRLLGAVPSGTTVLGGRYTGTGAIPGGYTQYAASVPMSAHAFDVFTAAAQKAGIDPSRIETVYGTQFSNAAFTRQIVSFAAKAKAQVDHIAVAPYWDTPADPVIIAAFAPAGSRADAQAWPVDAINDFVRHAFAYSSLQQYFWQSHAAAIAASKQSPRPTLVCYEGGFEKLVPDGTPQQKRLVVDCFAHPSARDLIYGWYAACQQGDPTTPGSGASHALYHVAYNSATVPSWYLATGTGQPAGDGSKNQYASYQGGFPADGHEHVAGPVRNVSPALQGLQDWGAAVANPQPAPAQ